MQYSPLRSIRSRLPSRQDVLGVFGVVLFAVFGWSIRGFLFKIPAFTLYFGLTSNLAILCYMFAFALLESLLVTALLVLLAFILPGGILRHGFAYKGFIIILVASLAMITFDIYYRVEYFKDIMAGDDSSIPRFFIGLAVSIAVLAALLWTARIQPRVQKIAQWVVDQMGIFTYIYVPLGLLGLIVVILRNLR